MNLSQQDWKTQLDQDENAVVLDVRTQDECDEGIIPTALQNDIFKGQVFIDRLEEMDKSKNYYVYCKAGSRSEQACAVMNQLGFEKTYNLIGGFINWDGEKVNP